MVTTRWPALMALVAISVAVAAAAQEVSVIEQVPRAETRERNLRAYVELLRSDIRTQKVAVVSQMMQLTEAEETSFWPIYREYEFELSKLNDERLRLIESYAENYDQLTDAKADELMLKALDLESRRTALKTKYYSQLKKSLSARVAARAVQVEHQIELLVDLQIAASLPIASTK
jgi:hypothetical protein